MAQTSFSVAIVGAGLVGTLEACYLARRDLIVDVYECRADMRQAEHVPGRSINLALSTRGLAALEGVGLVESVTQGCGIPLYGRMVHNRDGSTSGMPYSKDGQCLYSVERRFINQILLDEGEKYQNIRFHFHHKLIKANLDIPELTFNQTDTNQTVVVRPDLVIGCDGAYSSVRKEML